MQVSLTQKNGNRWKVHYHSRPVFKGKNSILKNATSVTLNVIKNKCSPNYKFDAYQLINSKHNFTEQYSELFFLENGQRFPQFYQKIVYEKGKIQISVCFFLFYFSCLTNFYIFECCAHLRLLANQSCRSGRKRKSCQS